MWVEGGCVSSSACASSRPSGRRGGAKGGGVCGGGTEPREAPVVYAGGAKGGGEIDGLVWSGLCLQNKGNHVPIRSRLWIVVVSGDVPHGRSNTHALRHSCTSNPHTDTGYSR